MPIPGRLWYLLDLEQVQNGSLTFSTIHNIIILSYSIITALLIQQKVALSSIENICKWDLLTICTFCWRSVCLWSVAIVGTLFTILTKIVSLEQVNGGRWEYRIEGWTWDNKGKSDLPNCQKSAEWKIHILQCFRWEVSREVWYLCCF